MSRKRSAGKSGLLSLILLIALAAVAFWGWQRYTGFADAPLVGTGGDKSIVVQPGAVLARRKVHDAAGVVHQYTEALAGEAMDGGPLMLSWEDVAAAGEVAERGHNLVIHEFVHKIDMHDIALGDQPGGSPPLPRGFLGHARGAEASAHWQRVMREAFARFTEAVSLAERFGGETPWLDDYAAHSPAEFFAVTCEAYFVSRERFGTEFPELVPLYDGLFQAAVSRPR